MTLTALFLFFFLVGPLSFRLLTKAKPSGHGMRRLAAIAVILALSGIVLRYIAPDRWGHALWLTGLVILLLWCGWIAVLALGAQALRSADPGPIMRRWTEIIGAAGTTVPWFGLASANLLSG